MELIQSQNNPRAVRGGHTAPLSNTDPGLRAIEHAIAMKFTCTDACFRMLYDYGAEPLDVLRANASTARLPVLSEATVASLGCDFQHECHGNWHVWTRTSACENPVYKVYLNPCFDDFAQFCLRIGPMLLDSRVAAFKTVTERWLAVRPDKFIVYFTQPSDRDAWLADLPASLIDLRPNPTPFTQYWSPDGFITVATDPKDSPNQSWRSTLLRSIAAMITAQPTLRTETIKAQIAVYGVDTTTWSRTDD